MERISAVHSRGVLQPLLSNHTLTVLLKGMLQRSTDEILLGASAKSRQPSTF